MCTAMFAHNNCRAKEQNTTTAASMTCGFFQKNMNVMVCMNFTGATTMKTFVLASIDVLRSLGKHAGE